MNDSDSSKLFYCLFVMSHCFTMASSAMSRDRSNRALGSQPKAVVMAEF